MNLNYKNDLPTAMTMFLIVRNTGKVSEKMIEKHHLNEWFLQYIGGLKKTYNMILF
jgi:hypothetical protein